MSGATEHRMLTLEQHATGQKGERARESAALARRAAHEGQEAANDSRSTSVHD